jgi:D-arabinose 5-phosphate isomerase GutQ
MSESDELQAVLDETAPSPAQDRQQIIVIGAGPMGSALGRSLASRLIAHCGDRIQIVDPVDCGLSMLPMPAPKDVYTAQMAGAQQGKGQRKARWNRKNRWR